MFINPIWRDVQQRDQRSVRDVRSIATARTTDVEHWDYDGIFCNKRLVSGHVFITGHHPRRAYLEGLTHCGHFFDARLVSS